MTLAGSTRPASWPAARRAVVLVLIVAVPVVFDTRVRPVFALPKFTVLVLGAVMLLVLLLAERAFGGAGRWRRLGLEIPLVALVAWTGMSAAASGEPIVAVFGDRESLNGVVTMLALVVVFVATAEAFSATDVKTALSMLWFGAGGVVLLYGAVQLAGGHWDPVPWKNTSSGWAVWSTLGNPNDLAGFLAIVLPIGLVLMTVARTAQVRVAAALMIVLALIELGATGGRGALLGAAAGVAALALWYRHELRQPRRLLLAAAGVLAGVVLATAALSLASGPGQRDAGEIVALDEGSTAGLRLELWRTAWRTAEENPVFGVGPDRFARTFDEFRSKRFVRLYGPDLLGTDAHNIFLSHLATTGFPGLFAFLFLVAATGVVFRRTARGVEQPALLGAVGAALVAYLAQACFNRQDIALDFCAWLLLGLLYALARSAPPSRRRGRNRAAMATTTASAPTASATQEITSPSSS